MRKLLQLFIIIFLVHPCFAQDSLRGSLTPERIWWDVIKYDITVEPDTATKTLSGSNIITFKTTAEGKRMQIDLQEPMEIVEVSFAGKKADGRGQLSFTRLKNVYYIDFNEPLKKEKIVSLNIKFAGKPREAIKPPWDGGWIWRKDKNGQPWLTVACQGLGASVWYPCKDHQSDEPDSATLSIIVNDPLIGVGNGRLRSKVKMDNNKTQYTWAVTSPINNYNIVPYIGNYVNWTEKFAGEKGELDMSYWVLQEDEQKAKQQFTQAAKMMKCFEHWFGPYPFYEDGYKLVESPHLGMEHQSGIAYGNKFGNGYLGTDLSGTGWGDKWDFIIVHESGHEWFGNNITTNDIADMWVHEGFTNYSESLFTQCEYGKEAGNEYVIGLRRNIKNDIPVIGQYGMNREGSEDMYYKGANLVHMIRQIMNDDEKFRQMLRGLNEKFYHKTINAADIQQYINKAAGKNLDKVFDQYLRNTSIPVFEYKFEKGKLNYRWSNCIKGFNMPLKIIMGKNVWLYPTEKWQTISTDSSTVTIDRNFYVSSRKM